MLNQRLLPCFFVVAALSVTCASAATITTYTRATFQAASASSSITTQNFDSLASGTILSTLNGVTYGASGGNPLVTNSYLTTTAPNGLGSTSIGFFLPTEIASFSFATSITAFAIDVNTYAPAVGGYTATLSLGNVVSSKFDVFPGTATGQFLGIVSDTPFSSVQIRAVSGFSYTLDTLVYGSGSAVVSAATPEPSTVGLLGGGLGLIVFAIRKRKV